MYTDLYTKLQDRNLRLDARRLPSYLSLPRALHRLIVVSLLFRFQQVETCSNCDSFTCWLDSRFLFSVEVISERL